MSEEVQSRINCVSTNFSFMTELTVGTGFLCINSFSTACFGGPNLFTFTVILLQKKNKGDKDLLYDRIADSYVALFSSINQDVKDKFLMVSIFF